MPAAVPGATLQRNEQMWKALKIHILRERQRKKQGKDLFYPSTLRYSITFNKRRARG